VKTAAEAVAAYRPSTESRPPAESGRTVLAFWTRMAEMYGHKWTSQQGDKPTALWSKAISGLSADELREGIRGCLANGHSWPPSLPEFMAMAKPRKRENEGMYRALPQLPAPKSSQETARRELQKLFLMVGRGQSHGS